MNLLYISLCSQDLFCSSDILFNTSAYIKADLTCVKLSVIAGNPTGSMDTCATRAFHCTLQGKIKPQTFSCLWRRIFDFLVWDWGSITIDCILLLLITLLKFSSAPVCWILFKRPSFSCHMVLYILYISEMIKKNKRFSMHWSSGY